MTKSNDLTYLEIAGCIVYCGLFLLAAEFFNTDH